MNILILFLAVFAAAGVWWLIVQRLTVKPWAQQGALSEYDGRYPPGAIGLGVFLAVVTSLFALFVSAYYMRMTLDDWRPLPEPGVLWLNTGVLVLGSIAMQWSWVAGEQGKHASMRYALLAGGVFAAAFLLGQWWAWQQLQASGYFLTGNPANAFFYLITGLHALHLLGGLWVWGRTARRCWREAPPGPLLNVKLCAVYWHYLLLIWVGIFALLSST